MKVISWQLYPRLFINFDDHGWDDVKLPKLLLQVILKKYILSKHDMSIYTNFGKLSESFCKSVIIFAKMAINVLGRMQARVEVFIPLKL